MLGEARQGPRRECRNLIWRRRRSASTWPAWRSGSTARCTHRALAELSRAGPSTPSPGRPAGAAASGAAGPPRTRRFRATFRAVAWVPRTGTEWKRAPRTWSAQHARRPTSPPYTKKWPATPWRRPAPRARRVAAVESAADLANAPDVLTGMLALPEGRGAAGGPAAGRAEAMLGYSDSAQELGSGQRHTALVRTPRPGWRLGRGQRRPADPFHGAAADLGRGGGRRAGRAGPGARFGTARSRSPSRARSSSPVTASRPIAKRPPGEGGARPCCSPRPRGSPKRTAAAARGLTPTSRPDRRADCAACRRLVEADGFAGWSARISRWARSDGMRIAPARPSAASAPRARRGQRVNGPVNGPRRQTWTWPTCGDDPRGLRMERRPDVFFL